MEGWYFEPGSVLADEFALARIKDANYHRHFISWWPSRGDPNVLYLVYEHMIEDLDGAIQKIAAFMDIELDKELWEIVKEHASLAFMKRYKDRFDDAMLRRLSEQTLLPAGSDSAKVRVGKVGLHHFGPRVVEQLDQVWKSIVMPVTGFDTYETLIASLK